MTSSPTTTTTTASDGTLSVTVPAAAYTGKNVLVKIDAVATKSHEPNKFRSFCLPATDTGIIIGNKTIPSKHLFDVLKQHGLAATVPMHVSFVGALPTVEFRAFDWHPYGYCGPTVWPFNWDGVACSITAAHNSQIYVRVYDLGDCVGERILQALAQELLKFWRDPAPVGTLNMFTAQTTTPGRLDWATLSSRLCRDIETIYIDCAVKSKLVTQLAKFLRSSDMYDRYGVTWKRVHLFHGPPGSGKTSTILALASVFHYGICKMTITPDMTARAVEHLFQSVPMNCFLVIEDADALFCKRQAQTGVDFSTMINCMDGLTTKRGLVLFLTTNIPSAFDTAFLRPGRIDVSVEFKLPGRDELHAALKVLGAAYAHEHEAYLDKWANAGLSIADVQKHLFECLMEEHKTIL